MTNLQPNTISDGLKELVWYLPSGAGGMAAGYKSMMLAKQIREWAEKHQVNINECTRESFIDYEDNQKKYYRLIVPEKIAILFMLTWLKEKPLKITDYSAC
jgi:hypothetical protein